MRDSDLRSRERDLPRDPGEETAHLRARLRAEEIDPAHVLLAAALGSEPARSALHEGFDASSSDSELLQALRAVRHETTIRVCLAACRGLPPSWLDSAGQQLLGDLEAWVQAPTPEALAKAKESFEGVKGGLGLARLVPGARGSRRIVEATGALLCDPERVSAAGSEAEILAEQHFHAARRAAEILEDARTQLGTEWEGVLEREVLPLLLGA